MRILAMSLLLGAALFAQAPLPRYEVHRAATRITIDGKPIFSFPTVWNNSDTFQSVDPYDARYWAVDWSRLPRGVMSF